MPAIAVSLFVLRGFTPDHRMALRFEDTYYFSGNNLPLHFTRMVPSTSTLAGALDIFRAEKAGNPPPRPRTYEYTRCIYNGAIAYWRRPDPETET